MKVIVDSREQRPWTFPDLGIETISAKLESGDYSVAGLESCVAIERKSIDDFCGTVLRDRARFYRELERLRAYEHRAVIIESSVRDIHAGRYTSQVSPRTVLGFVAEIAVGQSVPVYLGGTRAEAQILAAYLLRAASKKIGRHPGRG